MMQNRRSLEEAPDIAIWQWPNVLGLDAPIVAIVWQGLVARSMGIPLRMPGRVALFLTVWAIYVADRILDARNAEIALQSARHRLARRQRRRMLVLLIAVCAADLAVTFWWLRPAVVVHGLAPLAGVVLYLVALHGAPESARLAKEPAVALLFAAGTFLVAWTNAVAPVELLVGPALSFFLLCLANLLAIEKWEWRELRGSPPHAVTATLIRLLPAGLGLLTLVSTLQIRGPRGEFYAAIAGSAALISLILLTGRRLPVEARRTLVDAVLCTPLVFLI